MVGVFCLEEDEDDGGDEDACDLLEENLVPIMMPVPVLLLVAAALMPLVLSATGLGITTSLLLFSPPLPADADTGSIEGSASRSGGGAGVEEGVGVPSSARNRAATGLCDRSSTCFLGL